MKALLCLPLLFSAAWAEEASDREAVARVIARVNEVPLPASIFTADSDAAPALERLRKPPDHPTVIISHEPWGEATIQFPGRELRNPRIITRAVRFLTPDVALADAACVYDDAAPHTRPLLFVMKREGGSWKIASVRLLAHP
jgi:hypothetical protein